MVHSAFTGTGLLAPYRGCCGVRAGAYALLPPSSFRADLYPDFHFMPFADLLIHLPISVASDSMPLNAARYCVRYAASANYYSPYTTIQFWFMLAGSSISMPYYNLYPHLLTITYYRFYIAILYILSASTAFRIPFTLVRFLTSPLRTFAYLFPYLPYR